MTAPDPVAQVDAYLDDLADGLRAPRKAKRALRKAGGVKVTAEQSRAAMRWARAIERGEVPAEISKPKRGAGVLKGGRGRAGRRPAWVKG